MKKYLAAAKGLQASHLEEVQLLHQPDWAYIQLRQSNHVEHHTYGFSWNKYINPSGLSRPTSTWAWKAPARSPI